MTISLLLTDITDAIAGLSISGVTIRDVDQISANWQSVPNVLYPNPEGFISDMVLDYRSFLRGASAPVDVSYTLNYRFLNVQIGDLGNMAAQYGDMVSKLTTIINALMSEDAPYSGKVDLAVLAVSVGARADPAGNLYHGADIALRIMEQQN